MFASSAQAAFRIADIRFDSPGADNGSNSSLNGEWIRIRNTGNSGRKLLLELAANLRLPLRRVQLGEVVDRGQRILVRELLQLLERLLRRERLVRPPARGRQLIVVEIRVASASSTGSEGATGGSGGDTDASPASSAARPSSESSGS